MAEHVIDSLGDPRLDPYRELKRTNLTRWSGQFIVEGVRVVERLLESDLTVDSVFVSQAYRRRLPDDLGDRCELFVAPQQVAEMIVGYRFHAGALACARRPEEVPLHEWAPPAGESALLIGCPDTTDPDNLGTLMRTAAAFGASGLLLGKGCADPFSRRTVRVSMGTIFRLRIHQPDCFETALQELQGGHGIAMAASVLSSDSIPLSTFRPSRRTMLLLGNEAQGLSDEIASRADVRVRIPMASGVDSLNVGVAAGVMLHHIVNQASDGE